MPPLHLCLKLVVPRHLAAAIMRMPSSINNLLETNSFLFLYPTALSVCNFINSSKHQAYLSKPDEHRVDAMLLPLDQQLDAFASRFAYTRATLSDHLSVFTLTTC